MISAHLGQVSLIPGQLGKDASKAVLGEASEKAKAESRAAEANSLPSKLAPEVRSLIELIFSEKMMRAQLEAQSIDLDKMPLGAISDRQVERGYAQLRELSEAISHPIPDEGGQAEKLLALTNAFYNTIPHKFERKLTPPIITTNEMLIEKVDAIESLLQARHHPA